MNNQYKGKTGNTCQTHKFECLARHVLDLGAKRPRMMFMDLFVDKNSEEEGEKLKAEVNRQWELRRGN